MPANVASESIGADLPKNEKIASVLFAMRLVFLQAMLFACSSLLSIVETAFHLIPQIPVDVL